MASGATSAPVCQSIWLGQPEPQSGSGEFLSATIIATGPIQSEGGAGAHRPSQAAPPPWPDVPVVPEPEVVVDPTALACTPGPADVLWAPPAPPCPPGFQSSMSSTCAQPKEATAHSIPIDTVDPQLHAILSISKPP